MRILIADTLQLELLECFLDDNVSYRPDLLTKPVGHISRALTCYRADAVISRSPLPKQALDAWLAACDLRVYHVHLLAERADNLRQRSMHYTESPFRYIPIDTTNLSDKDAYTMAFETLERECCVVDTSIAVRPQSAGRSGRDVVMIGGGLVNLVTAYWLQTAGFRPHIIDASPDPRVSEPWIEYGCSRGGDDARMFTLSEMNCRASGSSNYPEKLLSPTMNSQFRRSVIEQGWSIRRSELSRGEDRWVQEFEALPLWLAHKFNEDIFALTRESYELWESWMNHDPSLFEAIYLRKGILRVFADPTHFERKVSVQARIGATTRVLTPREIANDYPALADAVSQQHIVGGIEGIGFTIRAHEFMKQLIDRLESLGTRFSWRLPAHKLRFGVDGAVEGIDTDDGLISASHFVISPGAYGHTLVEGTQSHGRIHGVLGVWVKLPNIEPRLTQSIKISGTGHTMAAANVAVSKDMNGQHWLIFGSGYGHTGVDPHNIDESLLHRMYDGIADLARKYFPKPFDAARTCGGVQSTFRHCVRGWTATGLGVFESLSTVHGGKCIITGGHNTGGFAQAPAVAKATVDALEGREHLMHSAYRPDRASRFLDVAPHKK
jgi:glycine/D-amino acid oxidase-like deaminating enzyme